MKIHLRKTAILRLLLFPMRVHLFGAVEIDGQWAKQALQSGFVQTNDEAHREEHCLEIHLPFLLTLLEDFKLCPARDGQGIIGLLQSQQGFIRWKSLEIKREST